MKGARPKDGSSSPVPSSVSDASLSAKILQAQDDERRRISRELHDSVGQSLTAAKLPLGKLKQKFTDADLDEADQRVDEALNEVRTVSHLLHPASLELLGLRSSILSYVEGFEQRTGIKTFSEIADPLPKFDDVTSTALFRIIQECVTNVYKHAKASAISIRIGFSAEQFRMEVVDDGSGFQSDAREGVGIRGMRERLKELGGTLYVESGENLGSSVIAIIPLNCRT
jgi:two-component system, NarL family, sensor kinase